MSPKENLVTFEESLLQTDVGLIICGKTGKLKGLWIPDGANEQVSDGIVNLCKDYFGIDPNEEDQQTFH